MTQKKTPREAGFVRVFVVVANQVSMCTSVCGGCFLVMVLPHLLLIVFFSSSCLRLLALMSG